jgi:hypothetical protein
MGSYNRHPQAQHTTKKLQKLQYLEGKPEDDYLCNASKALDIYEYMCKLHIVIEG